ncbi:hypothetical protein AB0M48_30135 [Lentzea sp. NPDC051208]|uniref:hypothetical protein n=1 Tax=Lentzea sp. NPDC051208 TaxID=3154642 RepID=UPI0034435A54
MQAERLASWCDRTPSLIFEVEQLGSSRRSRNVHRADRESSLSAFTEILQPEQPPSNTNDRAALPPVIVRKPGDEDDRAHADDPRHGSVAIRGAACLIVVLSRTAATLMDCRSPSCWPP